MLTTIRSGRNIDILTSLIHHPLRCVSPYHTLISYRLYSTTKKQVAVPQWIIQRSRYGLTDRTELAETFARNCHDKIFKQALTDNLDQLHSAISLIANIHSNENSQKRMIKAFICFAQDSTLKNHLIEAGAVSRLFSVVYNGSSYLRGHAALCIYLLSQPTNDSMAANNYHPFHLTETQQTVLASSLVNMMLCLSTSGPDPLLKHVMGALCTIAEENPSVRVHMVSSGLVCNLVPLVLHEDLETSTTALHLLECISHFPGLLNSSAPHSSLSVSLALSQLLTQGKEENRVQSDERIQSISHCITHLASDPECARSLILSGALRTLLHKKHISSEARPHILRAVYALSYNPDCARKLFNYNQYAVIRDILLFCGDPAREYVLRELRSQLCFAEDEVRANTANVVHSDKWGAHIVSALELGSIDTKECAAGVLFALVAESQEFYPIVTNTECLGLIASTLNAKSNTVDTQVSLLGTLSVISGHDEYISVIARRPLVEAVSSLFMDSTFSFSGRVHAAVFLANLHSSSHNGNLIAEDVFTSLVLFLEEDAYHWA